jgi:UDP:flavonoid glycosyltransferase YjiC (YdhE family)
MTYAGGRGHREPLEPIAAALRDAGHEATFLDALPEPADAEQIQPLRPLDMAHEYRVLRRFYAGSEARARAPMIVEHLRRARPDVIVCDETDFGAMVAAERCGVPHVTVLVTAAGSFVRPEILEGAVDRLRARHGLPSDPDLAMPHRDLVVSPFPPSLHDPSFPLPANAVSVRPSRSVAGNGAGWAPPATGRPLVYVTLGTVFNTESGDLFDRLLTGLRDLPIEALVTVGSDLDPARFGPQPSHIRIERFVPQGDVLPHCAAAINHAGSGSVVGALAFGVPIVLIPMGADQGLNAARCEALGVGVTLEAVEATARQIADAVAAILMDPGFAEAAAGIREEIAALPEAEIIVPLIERLV